MISNGELDRWNREHSRGKKKLQFKKKKKGNSLEWWISAGMKADPQNIQYDVFYYKTAGTESTSYVHPWVKPNIRQTEPIQIWEECLFFL